MSSDDPARSLFYSHGVRATGVDTVAREAGVAPTTLYRVFRDKEDMVGQYVQRAADRYRSWFDAAVEAREGDDAVIGLFEAQAAQVADPGCRGCPFQLALAELPGPDQPGRRAAVELKTWVHQRLVLLGAEHLPDAHDKPELADHLMVIMEGVYASVLSGAEVVQSAHVPMLVRDVIAAHTRPS